MHNHSLHRNFLFAFLAISCIGASVFAQTTDTTVRRRILRDDIGIYKKLTVMPYATLSYNLQSGQAFPKNAQGLGYGFGLAVDLTQDTQKLGLYFDLAYQDMRANSSNGSCGRTSYSDTVYQSLNVTHYFSYVAFESFLKIQSSKTNGYLLLGASFGLATTQLTVREGAIAEDKYSDWNGATNPANNTTYSNKFRLDIRAGIGIKLGYISGHQVVFEARFGYPVTTAISDYHEFCIASPSTNSTWRIVTLQGNIGLRL
jgi:hypothetical protein